MLLNKIDLLPYSEFDAQRCIEYARRINPAIGVLRVSAKTGQGVGGWIEWIQHGMEGARAGRRKAVASPPQERVEQGARDAISETPVSPSCLMRAIDAIAIRSSTAPSAVAAFQLPIRI